MPSPVIDYSYAYQVPNGDLLRLLPAGVPPKCPFKVFYGTANLGTYPTLEEALARVCSNMTDPQPAGIDFSQCDIPGDLQQWEQREWAKYMGLKAGNN